MEDLIVLVNISRCIIVLFIINFVLMFMFSEDGIYIWILLTTILLIFYYAFTKDFVIRIKPYNHEKKYKNMNNTLKKIRELVQHKHPCDPNIINIKKQIEYYDTENNRIEKGIDKTYIGMGTLGKGVFFGFVEKNEHHIKNIISKYSITEDAIMLIPNGAYFKITFCGIQQKIRIISNHENLILKPTKYKKGSHNKAKEINKETFISLTAGYHITLCKGTTYEIVDEVEKDSNGYIKLYTLHEPIMGELINH